MSMFAPDQAQGAPPAGLAALLGGGGGEEAPPEIDTSGSGDGPSSAHQGSNSDNLRTAMDAISQYISGEQDDQDLALAHKIQSEIQKLLADQQKLQDQATGAGPGERMVRKSTAGGGY